MSLLEIFESSIHYLSKKTKDMRHLILLLILTITQISLSAQIRGNGERTTITREFEDLSKVSININGKINIYAGAAESKIDITYDSNIVDLVATKKTRRGIELDQKEWIQGQEEVLIEIYTPELKYVYNDSWSKVEIHIPNQKKFKLESNISDITLKGKVEDLFIESESSNIYAYELEAINAQVKIKDDGAVYVNASENLDIQKTDMAHVNYKNEPQNITGLASQSDEPGKRKKIDTRFIDVKFKNTSFKRISAYVKGPKPDGSYFSYGLNFFPMIVKNERWSIGTKLYKIGWLGQKTLIHEVSAEDEGKVIKL